MFSSYLQGLFHYNCLVCTFTFILMTGIMIEDDQMLGKTVSKLQFKTLNNMGSK